MNPPSADSPTLSPSWLAAPPPPDQGWPNRQFLLAIGFVLAFHVALIFLFGTRKPVVPRPAAHVPHLRLAAGADEFIALDNPTLFALPNPHDVVSAFWRHLPPLPSAPYTWTENPRYLPPPTADLGANFRSLVPNRPPAELSLNFKPEPELSEPPAPEESPMPQATTAQISGDLAGRRVLNAVALPVLPRDNVIAPTTVQALVDGSGNVISTVVLQTSGDHDADQRAVQLTHGYRFAPASNLMFGDLRFLWHTVPLPATNGPAF